MIGRRPTNYVFTNKKSREDISDIQSRLPYSFKIQNIKKSIADANFILTALRSCLCFYNLNEEQLKNIKNVMLFCEVQSGAVIFKQYDHAQCFFILNKGSVKVNKVFEETISILKPGSLFGQNGIRAGENHEETAIAGQDCELWVLDRQTLTKAVETVMIEQYQDNRQILQSISFFSGISDEKKNKLATQFIEKVYHKGQTIVHEGDPGSAFLFIKEGSASAYKTGKFIKKLIQGDSFGEQSLLYNTIRQYTLLADEDCTLLLLGRNQLQQAGSQKDPQKIFGKFIRNAFRENITLKNLEQQKQKQLISIMKIQAYKASQTIFREGVEGFQKLVVVIEGKLINKKNGSKVADKGQCFGEQFLIKQNHLRVTQNQVITGSFSVLAQFTDFSLVHYFAMEPPNYILDNFKALSNTITEKIRKEKHEIKQKEPQNLFFIRKLKQAAFGPILLITDSQSNLFVLKIYEKSLLDEQSLCELVVNESQILKKVNHPFIMKCGKTFQTLSYACFFNQFINGEDFVNVMNREGIFTPQMTKFYVANVLLMLQYLHSMKIGARDIRPQNFMVCANGYLKLIGMSFAKQFTNNVDEKQRTYTIIGTPHYIAPEIILGKGYTTTADLWGLGVLAFELICGMYPFGEEAQTPFEIYEQIMQGEYKFAEFVTDKNTLKFISQLLSRKGSQRLGASYQQLKRNPWFYNFHWDKLIQQEQGDWIPYTPKKQQINAQQFDKIPLYEYLKNQEKSQSGARKPVWRDFGQYI